MCQLIIEYLLNVQNYLLSGNKDKDQTIEASTKKLEQFEAACVRKNERIIALKRELKLSQKALAVWESGRVPPPPSSSSSSSSSSSMAAKTPTVGGPSTLAVAAAASNRGGSGGTGTAPPTPSSHSPTPSVGRLTAIFVCQHFLSFTVSYIIILC
jgi:hypothetical protein